MKKRLLLISLLLLPCLISACFGADPSILPPFSSEPSPDTPEAAQSRKELASLLEDIEHADGYCFSARDSMGHSMDGAKIIANSSAEDSFLAVYHTYDPQGVAQVHLADSTDLLHWQHLTTLAGKAGENATQPTIHAVGNGFMLAFEQEPDNHLAIVYYATWEDLLNNVPANRFDAPQTLSDFAEGTPCIYAATPDSADIGFHYFRDGIADRQSRGWMTDWESWKVQAQPQIDEALLSYDISGNIGDRDLISYQGRDFLYMEGGGDNAHFENWRCFLYDIETQAADLLDIKTPGGSQAFSNPTATRVVLQSRPALVCSIFIPSESSASGEAGCCIYYHYLDR